MTDFKDVYANQPVTKRELEAALAEFAKDIQSNKYFNLHAPLHFLHELDELDLAHLGGANWRFDFLVDSNWTGMEGQQYTSISGHTYKVYSTVQGAITQADADNDVRSIGIMPGRYNENLTIAATFGTADHLTIVGVGDRVVDVGGISANDDALTISDGSPLYRIRGIRFRGGSSGHSLVGDASNIDGVFTDCEFQRSVSADFAGAYFQNCDFQQGYDVDSGHSPATVIFVNCRYDNASTWLGDVQDHHFIGCAWGGSQDVISATASSISGCKFIGCVMDTSGGLKKFFHFNSASDSLSGLTFDGCDFGSPADANGLIHIQATSGVDTIIITDNSFKHAQGSTNPYIVSDDADVDNAIIQGNAFGSDGSGNYVEDSGGESVKGNFSNSVFGPNAPGNVVKYDITGSNNEFYPTSSSSGPSTPSNFPTKIIDADGDTSWDTEQSADEDILRGKAAGTELMTLGNEGAVEILHTAGASNEHALEIIVNDGGFGNISAIDIDYVTNAIVAGEDEEVILVNIDESLAQGGNVVALEVLATEGAATIHAIEAAALVGPVLQLSGTFANMASALVKAVDRLTEFTTSDPGGANNIVFFVANGDTITIGDAAKFEEIEFLLDTVASKDCKIKFEFSSGAGPAYTEFFPADGTNGMRNTGVIAWAAMDVVSWVAVGGEFLIRLTRTKGGSITSPIEDKVQIAAVTEYEWDKDGVITAKNFVGTGLSDADGDTQIQVEESADEDKIRSDTGGTERTVLDARLALVGALLNIPVTAKTVSSDQIALADGNTSNISLAGAGGSADDLDGITGGTDGDILIIHPVSDSVTITVKHDNAGGDAGAQIFLGDNADLALSSIDYTLTLLRKAGVDGANSAWIEIARNLGPHELDEDTHHAKIHAHDSAAAGGTNVIPDFFQFPRSAAPSGTSEGQAEWDTDDDLLKVGDGSGQQTFLPVDDATSDPLASANAAADGTEDSIARKDHVHPTGLTVKEEDGTPSVSNVVEIKVTNATLTDNGSGSVSITTGGGGGAGVVMAQVWALG